jgi:dTDP-4-amino-4,6-dideoxygalactose transaminase
MATAIQIPFNRPSFAGEERRYMVEAMTNGHVSGDGTFSRRCHTLLEQKFGAQKALLTTSCTHALEMAALLLDLQAGDEVIVPSFTFVSTANAFVLRGARPVFADIRSDTLNIDEERIEALITQRTRALVLVHYAGVGCEMDALLNVAQRRQLVVIEDNAHGLFGKYKGRWLGSFGQLATQSFHETKNISCGEGGALLINEPQYIERAEIIREKGTNRSRFFRGQVDKYTWVDIGSSYLMSDLLAAFLFGQLEASEKIQGQRRQIWNRYDTELRAWAEQRGISCPFVPAYCEQAWHMYYLLLPSLEQRQKLIAHLKERGILSVFHYLPLHLSPMGRRFGGKAGDCPVTESISDRLLRLPFYNDLTETDQARIIATIKEFRVS